MPEMATSPPIESVSRPALRALGNRDPSTAPIGRVASSPSNSTGISVSQVLALPTARPLNRRAPAISVVTTLIRIVPDPLAGLLGEPDRGDELVHVPRPRHAPLPSLPGGPIPPDPPWEETTPRAPPNPRTARSTNPGARAARGPGICRGRARNAGP